MTGIDQLVERNIREHESRLKHIDELLARAQEGAGKLPEASAEMQELNELGREREKLVNHIKALKARSLEEWQQEGIEQSGPMIIWDAVAKQLERLVDRLGR